MKILPLKEWFHSKMKASDKLRLALYIMPFAFISPHTSCSSFGSSSSPAYPVHSFDIRRQYLGKYKGILPPDVKVLNWMCRAVNAHRRARKLFERNENKRLYRPSLNLPEVFIFEWNPSLA